MTSQETKLIIAPLIRNNFNISSSLAREGDLVKKPEITNGDLNSNLLEAVKMQSSENFDVVLSPEINLIKESLLSQKSEILNRNSEFKQAQLDISKMSDEGDQTAQELQNNISIQLHERERKSLLLIEKTLSKFSAGTYGECESCGDEIALKRLQARPLTPFCINCMEDHEEQSQQSGLFQ